MRVPFLIASVLLAPGCVFPFCLGYACEPCLPDLTLTVTDRTTHGPIEGVVTSAGRCTAQPCALYPGAGEHALTIEAAGYLPEQRLVTIAPSADPEGVCCRCETMPVTLAVELMPLL